MPTPFAAIVDFTPATALAGGLLIGLAALGLLAGIGRIAGISGMVHGLAAGDGGGWRASFLLGLVAGARGEAPKCNSRNDNNQCAAFRKAESQV